MVAIGILITFLGFLVSLLSLGVTESVGARLAMVLLGIALSFTGILGIINRAFQKNAIWRR